MELHTILSITDCIYANSKKKKSVEWQILKDPTAYEHETTYYFSSETDVQKRLLQLYSVYIVTTSFQTGSCRLTACELNMSFHTIFMLGVRLLGATILVKMQKTPQQKSTASFSLISLGSSSLHTYHNCIFKVFTKHLICI